MTQRLSKIQREKIDALLEKWDKQALYLDDSALYKKRLFEKSAYRGTAEHIRRMAKELRDCLK